MSPRTSFPPQLPVAVTTPRAPVNSTGWSLLPPFVPGAARTGAERGADSGAAAGHTPGERTTFAADDDIWGLWPIIDVNESTAVKTDGIMTPDELASRLEMLALRIRREGLQALTSASADEVLVNALSPVLRGGRVQ